MTQFLKNILEIFGVVYLRFRLLPRLWCVWLVAINAACLLFINHIEAQVVLGVTILSVVLQAAIYQNTGFSRILGIVHLAWIPMFVWMASRADLIRSDSSLSLWLILLFFTNLLSLLIDAIDVTRYINGEREPHYQWKKVKEVA